MSLFLTLAVFAGIYAVGAVTGSAAEAYLRKEIKAVETKAAPPAPPTAKV